MKSAIYIDSGQVQVVLTPQDEFEHNILKSLRIKPLIMAVREGSFYECQGGWVREGREFQSLIICVREGEPSCTIKTGEGMP